MRYDSLPDNEVIKALSVCRNLNTNCKGCPLENYDGGCVNILLNSVFDLTNRLQEEIDDLERIVGLMNKRKYYRKFVDEVYRKEKGNELSDPDFDYIYELYFKLQMEKNWHEVFKEFLASLTVITNGKQQYFEQEDGKWYSRISGEYLTMDEMIAEYLDDVKSFIE